MLIDELNIRPTIVTHPDSRFATTFLSTKYRDRAIAGEVLMDKISGELFIKRAIDGKIVSFYKNKKPVDELMSEFANLKAVHPEFIYPHTVNTALYVSTNYDLVAINNESLYNIILDDITISGTPSDINKLTFTVSGVTNGFFCKNTSRICDTVFIDYLTRYYNAYVKNYAGTDSNFIAESQKFNTITNWENSNAAITYDMIITKDGSTYTYTDNVDYIYLNEHSFVKFPEIVYTELGSFDSAIINIKSITYDKLHFMIDNRLSFGVEFNNAYTKFISADNRVEVDSINIIHFINNMEDLMILGNENIINTIEVPRVNNYLKALTDINVTISTTKPNSAGMWFKPKSE